MNKRFMVFVSLVLTLSLLCSLCPAALAEEDDSIRYVTRLRPQQVWELMANRQRKEAEQ